MLLPATFPLNTRIILLDPFSDGSSFYVVCICNNYCRANQNRLSVMGLTSHISCLSDALPSYRVSFSFLYWNCYYSTNYISLMMILTMMGLELGPLVNALFYVVLIIPLVVSVA